MSLTGRRTAVVGALALTAILVTPTVAEAAPVDRSTVITGAEFDAYVAEQTARDRAQDAALAEAQRIIAELQGQLAEQEAPAPAPAPEPEPAAAVTGVDVSYDVTTRRATLTWVTPTTGDVGLRRQDSTGLVGVTTQPANPGSYTFGAHRSGAEWIDYSLTAGGEPVTVRVDASQPTPEPAAPEPAVVEPVADLTWQPPAGWESFPERDVTANPNGQALLKGSGDVVIDLPDTITGPIIIDGYEDVVIVGGSIRALPVSQINGIDQRLIYVRNVTGTVHLEGLLLDGDVPSAETDGITANGARTVLQVQNTRIEGLDGLQATNHADCIQTWTGLKELRVDDFTCYSDYQGVKFQLTNGTMGPVTLGDVNLTAIGTDARYLYWMNPNDSVDVTLGNVWVDPYSSRPFGQSVWPGVTNKTNPAQVSDGRACWPAMDRVTGCIREGTPPGGDFVPAGSVGPGYTR